MSLNLNRITKQMPYGRTDYVPTDETRNFKALVPVSDEVKDRIDSDTRVIFKIDSEQYPAEKVNSFENGLKEHPLPTNDFRKLLWGKKASKLLDISSVYNSSSNKARKSLNTPQLRTREKEEINLSDLEYEFRSMSSAPFRVDHVACHLFDQPIALSHAKKLRLRIGHEVLRLNDPKFTKSLCEQIEKEKENHEEELAQQREEYEIQRAIDAKKKSRFAVDEYFEAMHLPQLCTQKIMKVGYCGDEIRVARPWEIEDAVPELPPLEPKCPKGTHNPCCFKNFRRHYKKVWKENTASGAAGAAVSQQASSGEEGRSRIFRMDTATSEDLEDEGKDGEGVSSTPKANRPGTEEAQEGTTLEEASLSIDRMSDMTTVNQLYANARGILNNTKEFTKYPIARGNQEEGGNN